MQASSKGGSDQHWAPRKDTDIRKLSALEALSRYGRLPPRGLDAIQITPSLWPTSALLDWLAILRRTPACRRMRAGWRKPGQNYARA